MKHHLSEASPQTAWSCTPEVILINIFTRLPVLDRLRVTQVCSAWRMVGSQRLAWKHFDYGVVDCRYVNRNSESLRKLHGQYTNIIRTHGSCFSRVHVVLFCKDSFEILNELARGRLDPRCCVVELSERVHMKKEFTDSLMYFLSSNFEMQELCLKNVHFHDDRRTAPMPIGSLYARHLKKLSLVFSFKQSIMTALTYLVNVTELTIFPQQLRYTWLSHLAKGRLQTLNIVGESDFWERYFDAISEDQWKQITQVSQLQVHCYLLDMGSVVVTPGMPLVTFVCGDSLPLDAGCLLQVLTPFSATLTTFIDFSLIDMLGKWSRTQVVTADDEVMRIVQTCTMLTTLALKVHLHSSTILLMVQLNPSLKRLFLREEMIQYVEQLPTSVPLDREMCAFAQENFTKDKFTAAMCLLLRYDWHPMLKNEYDDVLIKQYCWW